MSAIVSDTHALLWYFLDPTRLSVPAVGAFDQVAQSGDAVYVSAISLIEIAYLVEKGRFSEADWGFFLSLFGGAAGRFAIAPVDGAIAEAIRRIPRDSVPDMPDRIIAATALVLDLPLVTRDRRIRSAGLTTIW